MDTEAFVVRLEQNEDTQEGVATPVVPNDDTPNRQQTGAGAPSTKPKTKWTDTDVLHHGLETNQIPGYTRALSYQVSYYQILSNPVLLCISSLY